MNASRSSVAVPAAALAAVLVDEFIRCGGTEAVVAPGSRSAPLAFALHDAASVGRLRLHVRFDERSAAFLALGLAKVTGRPAVLVCTSGTAATNFLPAVVEASEAGVPMLVLTADRPPELRGTGANQTIDQLRLYGGFVRWFSELGVPERRIGSVRYWRSLTCRAWHACTGPDPGPVHLNVPLREEAADEPWPEPLDGRPGGRPWTDGPPPRPAPVADLPAVERGLLVLGDGVIQPEPLVALAEERGWPVLAEPSSNGRHGPNALSAYPYLLELPAFRDQHRPDLVVSAGRPGLSRAVLGLLDAAVQHIVLDDSPRWSDPVRSATGRTGVPPPAATRTTSGDWLDSWRRADARVRVALDAELSALDVATEQRVARDLGALVPNGGLLYTAASMPARHLDQHLAARTGLRILASRGTSGIDGLVSTAVGAALAHGGPAFALLGDLSLLHDQNGLLLGPHEPRPDLTLVVLDNDGGAIFSLLPQLPAGPAAERVLAAPHGIELTRVAAVGGLPCAVLDDAADLAGALRDLPGPGIRMLVVRSDRKSVTDLHLRLHRVASDALSSGPVRLLKEEEPST